MSVIFPIYGQFGAIGKTDSGQINCKTADFLHKKMLKSAKLRWLWYYWVYFLKLQVCTYLPNFNFLA